MNETSLIKEAFQKMKINHDKGQIEKIMYFKNMLIEANKSLNLIGPAESKDIIKKHILDSLAPLSSGVGKDWDHPGIKIIDIGSGAGLPGIPLGIFLPRSKITLLEKSGKKSDFLSRAAKSLCLDNVRVLNGRAEEIAREEKWRESFSVVVARAVTKFNILLELSIPFCIINGKIIFYKSKKVFSEIETAGDAANTLGGRIGDLVKIDIPGLDGFRTLLVLDKAEHTPKKFPRKFSQIKKRPL